MGQKPSPPLFKRKERNPLKKGASPPTEKVKGILTVTSGTRKGLPSLEGQGYPRLRVERQLIFIF